MSGTVDFETLGIKVDTSDVANASSDLDKLTTSAAAVEPQATRASSGIDKVSSSAQDLQQKVQTLNENGIQQLSLSFGELAKATLVVEGIQKAISYFEELTVGAYDTAIALGQLAERTGSSINTLESVREAAVLTGRDFDTLSSSFDRLAKSADQATVTTSKQAAAYAALGVNIYDANGHVKDAGTLYVDAAKGQANFADGSTKLNALMIIGGKTMADSIPTLNLVAEGHDNIVKSMEPLTVQAKTLELQLGLLKLGSQELGSSITADLITPVLNTVKAFQAMRDESNNTLSAVNLLGEAFKIMALGVYTLWIGISGLVDIVVLATKVHIAFINAVQHPIDSHPIDDIKQAYADFGKNLEGNTNSLLKFYVLLNAPPPSNPNWGMNDRGAGPGQVAPVASGSGKANADAQKAAQEYFTWYENELKNLDAQEKLNEASEIAAAKNTATQQIAAAKGLLDSREIDEVTFLQMKLAADQQQAASTTKVAQEALDNANADLLVQQKHATTVVGNAALEVKAADDINKAKLAITATTLNLTKVSDDGHAKEIADLNAITAAVAKQQSQIDAATAAQDKWIEGLQKQSDAQAFQNSLLGKSADDVAVLTATYQAQQVVTTELDANKAAALKALDDGNIALYNYLNSQIPTIQAVGTAFVTSMTNAKQVTVDYQNSFSGGWTAAFNSYKQSVNDASLAQQAFNDLTSSFETLITGVLSHAKDAWKSFATSIITGLEQIASKMIMGGVASFFSPTGANASPTSAGNPGGTFGLSNPYGPGFSLSNNTWGNSSSGMGPPTADGSMSQTYGDYASQALGGATIGAMIGSVGASLFGNSRNQAGMTEGGMVGGAIGSFFGPIGAIVGSVLGAALGSLIKSGGGPKVGGSASSDGGTYSSFDVNGGTRAFTPNQDDAQMQALVDADVASYATANTSLGGQYGQADFAFGFDSDPNGTADSRVRAGAKVNGVQVYSSNIDAGTGDPTATLALEAQRALLAALQASSLPTGVAKIIDSLDVKSATADSIQNAITLAAGYQALTQFGHTIPDTVQKIFDSIDLSTASSEIVTHALALASALSTLSDVMAKFADNAAGVMTDALHGLDTTPYQAVFEQVTALNKMVTYFDGSTTAINNLNTASVSFYNSLVQEVQQIIGMERNLNASFQSAEQSMTLQTLDPQGKYDFYQADSVSAQQSLNTATDPDQINALANRILSDETSSFNLLTPEQQTAELSDFITRMNAVNADAQQKLEAARQAVTDAAAAVLKNINDVLTAAAVKFDTAAQTQVEAADKTNTAPPIQVSVHGTVTVVPGNYELDQGG